MDKLKRIRERLAALNPEEQRQRREHSKTVERHRPGRPDAEQKATQAKGKSPSQRSAEDWQTIIFSDIDKQFNIQPNTPTVSPDYRTAEDFKKGRGQKWNDYIKYFSRTDWGEILIKMAKAGQIQKDDFTNPGRIAGYLAKFSFPKPETRQEPEKDPGIQEQETQAPKELMAIVNRGSPIAAGFFQMVYQIGDKYVPATFQNGKLWEIGALQDGTKTIRTPEGHALGKPDLTVYRITVPRASAFRLVNDNKADDEIMQELIEKEGISEESAQWLRDQSPRRSAQVQTSQVHDKTGMKTQFSKIANMLIDSYTHSFGFVGKQG